MPRSSAKRARITLFIERIKLIQKEQSNEFPFLINGKLPSERSRAYLFDKLREGLKVEELCIHIARLSQEEFKELCECLGDNRSIRILALSKEGDSCLEIPHLEDNWQSELLAAIKENGRITTVTMPGVSKEFAKQLEEVMAFNELKFSLGSYQDTKASRPFPKDEVMRKELQALMRQRHSIRIVGSLPPADILCVLVANQKVTFQFGEKDSLTDNVAEYLLNLYRDNKGELRGLEKVVCYDEAKQQLLREYARMGAWKKRCTDKKKVSCVGWPKTEELQRKYLECLTQCSNISALQLVSNIKPEFLRVVFDTLKGKGLKRIVVYKDQSISQAASQVVFERMGEHPDLESVEGVAQDLETQIQEKLATNRCLCAIRKVSKTLWLPCFPNNTENQETVLQAAFSACWNTLSVMSLSEQHVKCIMNYSLSKKRLPVLTGYVVSQVEGSYHLYVNSDLEAMALDVLLSSHVQVKCLDYSHRSSEAVIGVLKKHAKTCGMQSFMIDLGSQVKGYHESICAFLKSCPSLIQLTLSFVTDMSAKKRAVQYEKILPLIAEVISISSSLSVLHVHPALSGKPLKTIVEAVSSSHTIEKLVLSIHSESYCAGLVALAKLMGERRNIHTIDLSGSPVYQLYEFERLKEKPGISRKSMEALIRKLKSNHAIVDFKINKKELEDRGYHSKKVTRPAYTKAEVVSPIGRQETKNKDNACAYLDAVERKRIEVVRDHLEKKGVSLYVRDASGDSALHIAIRACSAQMTEFLMRRGFNTALTGKDGLTPMELLDQLSRDDPTKKPAYDKIRGLILKERKHRTAPKKKSSQKQKARDITTYFSRASSAVSSSPTSSTPAESAISVEPYPLWEQIVMGTIDPSSMNSEMVRADPFNQSKTLFHAVCQRPLLDSKIPLLVKLIELEKDSAGRVDTFGYSPLYALASIEAPNEQEARVSEFMAMHLLRAGADPREDVTDVIHGYHMSALHRAILSNNYRLAKMIIKIYLERRGKASDLLNIPNQLRQTPMHLAAAHASKRFISYFLIFPGIRFNISDILGRKPDQLAANSDRKAAFESYRTSYHPDVTGVCWPKSFDTVRWKDTVIPGDGIQAQLQQQCENSSRRGNPVTAKVSFVIRQSPSKPREVVSFLVDDKFVPSFHLADFVPTVSFCKAAIARAKHVPSDVVVDAKGPAPDRQLSALTAGQIEETFKEDPSTFKQLFHHGEESLVTALEEAEFHRWLLEQFRSKVSAGTKVYAAVVDAYSKYYVCANCQIALLGERAFVQDFSTLLSENNFIVPKLGYFSFLFRVGAGFHWKIHKKEESDHQDYRLDLRSRPRQFLQRDLSAQKATSFNSRRR